MAKRKPKPKPKAKAQSAPDNRPRCGTCRWWISVGWYDDIEGNNRECGICCYDPPKTLLRMDGKITSGSPEVWVHLLGCRHHKENE